MKPLVESAAALARRAHVEALLSAYPDVTPDEHSMLVRWFRREASALDVALLASEPRLARGYQKFRGDHIDRFTWRDLAKASIAAAAFVLIVGALMMAAS
jgi:hypothetical protein